MRVKSDGTSWGSYPCKTIWTPGVAISDLRCRLNYLVAPGVLFTFLLPCSFSRAKQMLGSCCLLNRTVRRVFLRLMTLYALPRYDEDDETGQQHQLVTLLRVNIGQVQSGGRAAPADHAAQCQRRTGPEWRESSTSWFRCSGST